jgi:hypothetical protein
VSKATTSKNPALLALNGLLVMAIAGLSYQTFNPEIDQSNLANFGGISTNEGDMQPISIGFANSITVQQSPTDSVPIDSTPATVVETSKSQTIATNIALVNKSLKGFNGGAAILNAKGELVGEGADPFKLFEPASALKVATVMYWLQMRNPQDVVPTFGNRKAIDVAKQTLQISNNSDAERMGQEIRLVEYESQFRALTGNNSLVVGNASGCPRTTYGINPSDSSDPHYCDGQNKTGKQNQMSAFDIAKSTFALDQHLASKSLKLSDAMTPSYENEFSGSSPAGSVIFKTGTIGVIKSLTGKVVDKYGVVYYFAFLNEGTDHSFAKSWHKAEIDFIYNGRLKPLK